MARKLVADGSYLDEEEREIMEAWDSGTARPLEGQALTEMSAKLHDAARQTLSELGLKSERMNIRMTMADMLELKRAAAREGLPYQSLVTSVLHKYVTGALVDMNEAKKMLDRA
jgi:predicted DNA binding CopG/RHH family protein